MSKQQTLLLCRVLSATPAAYVIALSRNMHTDKTIHPMHIMVNIMYICVIPSGVQMYCLSKHIVCYSWYLLSCCNDVKTRLYLVTYFVISLDQQYVIYD